MKKYILLILFVGINISIFAQLNGALQKYWYYREDRLKYFVVPGEKQGESEIMENRNAYYNYFPKLIVL